MTTRIERTRVLIVDESAVGRRVLADALTTQADIDVIAAIPFGQGVWNKLTLARPEVVVLAVGESVRQALSTLHRLKSASPVPVVVVVSGEQAPQNATLAVRLGASEIVPKQDVHKDLPEAVREAASLTAGRAQPDVQVTGASRTYDRSS